MFAENLRAWLGWLPRGPSRFLEEMGVEEELRRDAAKNHFGTHLGYLSLSLSAKGETHNCPKNALETSAFHHDH